MKLFIKKLCEKWGLETSFQAIFNFKRILCKMDSEEVSMRIWTNFDRLAITYLICKKSHFPIEVVLNSLQTQKDLELVFRSQFF